MARSLACVGVIAALSAAGVLADRTVRLTTTGPAIVRIEAGWFTMGSDDAQIERAVALCRLAGAPRPCVAEGFADETPAHRVQLAAFAIDRTEVTRRAYARCVAASVCSPSRVSDADPRLGRPEHPVSGVTWREARRFCAWAGGDLPSEAQWERAARGGSRRVFPWGSQPHPRLANHGTGEGAPDAADGHEFVAPVGSYPDARSAHGLLDLAGNVWEFTADRYAPDFYAVSPRIEPRGPDSGDHRVIRGGSWRSPLFTLRVTHRDSIAEHEERPDLGFRCAYPVDD